MRLHVERREPREPPSLEAVRYTVPVAEGDPTPYLSEAHGGVVRLHRVADFHVSDDGTRIACIPFPGVPWEAVEQLLVDQLLPRALYLGGHPCLHGSAVARKDGQALVLIGTSGSGKSTLSAALCRAGSHLLCDDAAGFDDDLRVQPGYPSLRLWRDSAEELVGELPRATPRSDKRRWAQALAEQSAPLRAVVQLVPDPEVIAVDAVDKTRGLSLLMRSVHRLETEKREPLVAELNLLSRIVTEARVVELRYVQRFERLDDVVRVLEAV